VIAAHGGVADVVGHSMGGKAAMALALSHPETVRRLVVADIAPVAYGHTQQPLIDAMRAVDLSAVDPRGDADAQLAAQVPEEACAPSCCNRSTWAGRAGGSTSTRCRRDGRDPRLARSGRAFRRAALFLSGAASDYVRPEHRPAIKRAVSEREIRQDPRRGPLAACRETEGVRGRPACFSQPGRVIRVMSPVFQTS
jgi:esterase